MAASQAKANLCHLPDWSVNHKMVGAEREQEISNLFLTSEWVPTFVTCMSTAYHPFTFIFVVCKMVICYHIILMHCHNHKHTDFTTFFCSPCSFLSLTDGSYKSHDIYFMSQMIFAQKPGCEWPTKMSDLKSYTSSSTEKNKDAKNKRVLCNQP